MASMHKIINNSLIIYYNRITYNIVGVPYTVYAKVEQSTHDLDN